MKQMNPPIITSLQAVASRRSDLLTVHPDLLIVIPGLNPREDYGNIEEFANQIWARGEVIEPFEVKLIEGKIVVLNGHRRKAALDFLKARGDLITEVKIIPETRGTTEQQRTIDFLTRNSGKPFTLFEEATVFARCKNDHEMTAQAIAKETGKSLTHVKNCFRLMETPDEIQSLIKIGSISPSLVIDLIRETHDDSAALIARVHEALEAAKSTGKIKASRKHVQKDESEIPPSEGPEETGESLEATGAAEETKETEEPPAEPTGGNSPDPSEAIQPVPTAEHQSGSGFDAPGYGSNGGGGGGGGFGSTDRNIERNYNRLNKALEEIPRALCNKGLFDFLEATLDFLEGTRSLGDLKELLLHSR